MVSITNTPVQVGDSYSTKYTGQATPTATDFIFSSVQDSIIVTNYGFSYITAISGGESVRVQPNGGIYRFKGDSDTVNIQTSQGKTNPITIEGRSLTSGSTGTDIVARADIQSVTTQLTEKVTNDRKMPRQTKYMAHAGANAIAPESTMPAFVGAGKAGYKFCETDVRITSDGYYIIMHDDTVDRMTNGTGKIVEMTLAQIQALTIDSGMNIGYYPNIKVPTFEQFLEVCLQYGMTPIIEYKPEYAPIQSDIQKFIDTLDNYNLLDTAHIVSFNGAALTMIRSLNKRITLQFIGDPTDATMNFAKQLGNCGVACVYTILTKEYIDNCHKNGVFVQVWTVNDYDIASKFISWGVDFISTNKVLHAENLGVY